MNSSAWPNFIWAVRNLSVQKLLSQIGHLWRKFPLLSSDSFRCLTKFLFKLNSVKQCSHVKLLVVLWVALWIKRLSFLENVFSHKSHPKICGVFTWLSSWDKDVSKHFLSLPCTHLMCVFKSFLLQTFSPQILQTNLEEPSALMRLFFLCFIRSAWRIKVVSQKSQPRTYTLFSSLHFSRFDDVFIALMSAMGVLAILKLKHNHL